jgi:hypothetical protein
MAEWEITMSKDRARISILSELMAFPTINQKDWLSTFEGKVVTGDLVSLNSAPASKWYLSWVREINPNNGCPKYLLESVDDGDLCWWGNVRLNIYSRERVRERPTWQWSDRQFKLYDQWLRVGKRNDAYIVLPCLPEFKDETVTLDCRIRFGLSDFSMPKTFPDWKKLKVREMDAYYKECKNRYNGNH